MHYQELIRRQIKKKNIKQILVACLFFECLWFVILQMDLFSMAEFFYVFKTHTCKQDVWNTYMWSPTFFLFTFTDYKLLPFPVQSDLHIQDLVCCTFTISWLHIQDLVCYVWECHLFEITSRFVDMRSAHQKDTSNLLWWYTRRSILSICLHRWIGL